MKRRFDAAGLLQPGGSGGDVELRSAEGQLQSGHPMASHAHVSI